MRLAVIKGQTERETAELRQRIDEYVRGAKSFDVNQREHSLIHEINVWHGILLPVLLIVVIYCYLLLFVVMFKGVLIHCFASLL